MLLQLEQRLLALLSLLKELLRGEQALDRGRVVGEQPEKTHTSWSHGIGNLRDPIQKKDSSINFANAKAFTVMKKDHIRVIVHLVTHGQELGLCHSFPFLNKSEQGDNEGLKVVAVAAIIDIAVIVVVILPDCREEEFVIFILRAFSHDWRHVLRHHVGEAQGSTKQHTFSIQTFWSHLVTLVTLGHNLSPFQPDSFSSSYQRSHLKLREDKRRLDRISKKCKQRSHNVMQVTIRFRY